MHLLCLPVKPMSRAVLCDACGNVCQDNQYFSLKGWQGKGEHHPNKRREEEGWEIKQLENVARLSADLCPTCLRDHVGIARLNPVKTRPTLMNDLQAKNPQMSWLALLRRTAGMASTSVTCDICQKDCMAQHLEIKSRWLTENGEELTAELCEQCVNGSLLGVVRFQSQPPKEQISEISVG